MLAEHDPHDESNKAIFYLQAVGGEERQAAAAKQRKGVRLWNGRAAANNPRIAQNWLVVAMAAGDPQGHSKNGLMCTWRGRGPHGLVKLMKTNRGGGRSRSGLVHICARIQQEAGS